MKSSSEFMRKYLNYVVGEGFDIHDNVTSSTSIDVNNHIIFLDEGTIGDLMKCKT